MIKMKCLLIAVFAVVVQCCLFAATTHADSDCDSCLEAALRPLYSQLDVFRDQLDAVHVSCKKGGLASSWSSAGDSDPNPWIQVDLGCNVIITSLITQGRGDHDQWVTEFQVAYSDNGQEWADVTVEGECAPTKFPGNSDRNTHVTTTFPKAFHARFLRILPTQWSMHCSMRFEILGCKSHE